MDLAGLSLEMCELRSILGGWLAGAESGNAGQRAYSIGATGTVTDLLSRGPIHRRYAGSRPTSPPAGSRTAPAAPARVHDGVLSLTRAGHDCAPNLSRLYRVSPAPLALGLLAAQGAGFGPRVHEGSRTGENSGSHRAP